MMSYVVILTLMGLLTSNIVLVLKVVNTYHLLKSVKKMRTRISTLESELHRAKRTYTWYCKKARTCEEYCSAYKEAVRNELIRLEEIYPTLNHNDSIRRIAKVPMPNDSVDI